MRVSVVIPNRDGTGMVGRCVEAAVAAGAFEVIVVDDGSTDESPGEAAAAGATVVSSAGLGFAAAVNTGAAQALGEILLALNSDCFLRADTIRQLVDALAANDHLGICAASLVETDGTASKSHVPALTLGLAVKTVFKQNPFTDRRPGKGVEEVECVPLACAAIRRGLWEQVSGLDERFFFYFEDQDICRRLRSAGWQVAVDWDAVAVHVGGATSVARDEQRWFVQFARSRARYLRKHYGPEWLFFAAVWVPTALARALAWSLRRRPESGRWARAWWRAAWAGLTG